MIWHVVIATALVCGLGCVVLPLHHRVWTVPAFAALAAGLFVGAAEIAGTAKPLAAEWRVTEGAEVAGLYPDKARQVVYVWAVMDGEPVAYVIPWPAKDQDASDLLKRWRRREDSGERFFMAADQTVGVERPPPPPTKEDTTE